MVGRYCRAWFGWRFVLLFVSVVGLVDLQWTVFGTAPVLADVAGNWFASREYSETVQRPFSHN
jgi:hypothetical protein